MIPKDEKRGMKKHFLEIAKKCEKQNYVIQAADIYRRYFPKKAKNLYLKVAKDCEKNKLYIGAAEAYGLAGKMKKSRQVWKTYAEELKKKNLPTIEKEILEKATPPDPEKEKVNKEAWKIISLAKKLEREGRFSEAQKWAVKSCGHVLKIHFINSVMTNWTVFGSVLALVVAALTLVSQLYHQGGISSLIFAGIILFFVTLYFIGIAIKNKLAQIDKLKDDINQLRNELGRMTDLQYLRERIAILEERTKRKAKGFIDFQTLIIVIIIILFLLYLRSLGYF